MQDFTHLTLEQIEILIDYALGSIVLVKSKANPIKVDAVNGEWVETYDETVQAIIDSMTTEIKAMYQMRAKISVRSNAINGYSN